jgi:anti-anti-sigma regulatory factor
MVELKPELSQLKLPNVDIRIFNTNVEITQRIIKTSFSSINEKFFGMLLLMDKIN